jgi:hypothetical protein
MPILSKLFKRKPPTNSEDSQPTETSSAESLIGLRVLHEPKTESNIVSIVSVHGLGGSAIETWTHYPSEIFWPNLLHEDDRFANVRISTFGYDADFKNIFAVKNILGIQDFAKQLLDGLDTHYEEFGDVSIVDYAQLI